MTEHSPLPWQVLDDEHTIVYTIVDVHGRIVAVTSNGPTAPLIVERVNGWDALVKERDELLALLRLAFSNWKHARLLDGACQQCFPYEKMPTSFDRFVCFYHRILAKVGP